MNKKTVTIGIPVFLVENIIRESFDSALSQTYDDIYYIVVDDCGHDDSIKIVRDMIVNHVRRSRVTIIRHEHNLGLGEARNTIIRNAKTDFVYFMDSDDIIDENTIELLVRKSEKYDIPDIVIANHKTIFLDGKVNHTPSVSEDVYLSGRENILRYYEHSNIRISSWNKLYYTEYLKQNGIKYLHRYHEDFYFALQEVFYARSILIIPEETYSYILRNQSITGGLKLTTQMVDRLIPVADDIRRFILSHNTEDIIVAKKYLDLLSHILYVASVVDYPQQKKLLTKYKREKFPFSFLNKGITKLSWALVVGHIIPDFLFYYYWKFVLTIAISKRS